jgi:UDP-N-acetylmuramate dehydrogenase
MTASPFDGLALGEALASDAPLGKYTAARLGGNADWLYVAKHDEAELIAVVRAAWAADLPVRVIGGGANILVSDAGVRGLVVVNRHADITPTSPTDLHVSAGTMLTQVCRRCQALGLAGFEWAVAVPGTLGGAVVNNAGAHGTDTAAAVQAVRVLERDGVHTLPHAALGYAYRHSALKARPDRRFVVLSAALRLTPDDPALIQARMDEHNAYRKRTQPGGASLGSVFKNPPNDYAGRLIEAAGLKGLRVGSAMVSDKHANFIVNDDAAGSAGDYYRLVRAVQREVAARFGVQLETEIEFIGAFED